MSDYNESQDLPESSDLPSEPQDASNSPAIQRSIQMGTQSYMDVSSSYIPSTPPPPPASSSMPPPSTIPKKRPMRGREPGRESGTQKQGGIDDTLEFIEIDESGEREFSPKRQRTDDPDDESEKPELILEHAEPDFRAGPVFHYPRLYEELEHAKNRGVDVGPSGSVVIRYEPFEGRGVTPPPGSENWKDPKPHLYSTMEDIEEIYTLHSMQQPEESELEVQATPADKQETETTDRPQSPLAATPVEVQDVEITDVCSIGGAQGKENVSGTQSQSVAKGDPPGHPTTVPRDVQVIVDDQPSPPPPTVPQPQVQEGVTAGQPTASAAAGSAAKSTHPEQSTEGVLAVAPQVATAPPVLPMGDTMAAGDGAQTQRVGHTPAQPPYSLVTQHHSPSQQDGAETNPPKPAAKKEELAQMLGEEIVKFAKETNQPIPGPPPPFKEPKKKEVDIRRIGKKRLEKAFQYMGVCRRMRTWGGPPESASIQRPPNMNLSALPRHPGFSRPARRESSSAAAKTHKTQHAVKTEPNLPRNVLMESVEAHVQEQGPGRRSARTASQKTQVKTTGTAVPTSSVTQAEPPTQRTSRQPSVASGTEPRRSTRKATAPAGSRASSVESTRSRTTKKGAKKAASKAPRELEVVVEEEGEEQGEEREQAQEEERDDDDEESEAEDSPSPSPRPVTAQKGKGKAGTKGVTKAATSKKTGTAQEKATAVKGAKAKTTTKTTKAPTAKRGGKKTTAKKS